MTYDEIKNAWNAQADDGNRWHSLSEAEKIEWAAIHAAAKERTARQAAQAEVAELKGRIARAGVEQRRALHKALQQERDAEEGKVVRGEMADELLATVGQAQAVPCAIVRAAAEIGKVQQ